MRKVVVGLIALLATAAIVAGAGASGGPEARHSGFGCALFNGNGSLELTFNSLDILYASGKDYLRCEKSGVAPHPSGAKYTYNYANTGVGCSTIYTFTLDWTNTVGYNGSSQLTCIGQVGGNSVQGGGGPGAG